MGTPTWLVATSVVCAATATAACGTDTGIVLEISMSSELETALDQEGTDFHELRIWVGHTTEVVGRFAASSDAYYSAGMSRVDFAEPFRYLLEPEHEDLAAVGAMMFAVGVGDDPDDARLPFRLQGFAASARPMDFAEGVVRVVPLKLLPPDGATGTIDDACVVWDMNTQTPSRITPDDDLDCDGAVGADDCDDLDPRRNNLDADGDTFASCEGDCMDDPHPSLAWLDPAQVHPGAIDDEVTLDSCDHIDHDCDGICRAPSLDRDQSGATFCGPHVAVAGVCPLTPADCDENLAGNQVATSSFGEACNGRDDECDGFLPPTIPCIIPELPDKCFFGSVSCDEIQGEYVGEPEMLECKPLPGAFSQAPAPPALCGVAPTNACLESTDPVGCPTATGAARIDCVVPTSSESTCPASRTPLVYPGTAPTEQCAWLIVGGTQHAEWEIGFVEANATGDLTPMATIAQCEPHLVARPRTRLPTARTALLLLMTPQNPSLGVLPLFVHVQPEPDGTCAASLACQVTPPGA